MNGYLLALDQGNTHTRAVVAQPDGTLLSLAISAGASHAYVGMDKAMRCITEAARAALQQAKIRPAQLDLILGGITGADWADEYPLLEENIRQLGFCSQVKVVNDSIIALRAGTERPYGVILIAGSGGNCAVRAPDGREFIYGYFQEWPLQGADGLGRQALEAVYRAHTGREPETSLAQCLLEAFKLPSIEALKRADVENRLDAEDIRQLTVILFAEGYRGDPLANQVIRRYAEGSAELVAAGLRRFDMTGLELDVVLSGSIFKARGSLLIETIAAGIHAVAPRARLVNARYEPVVGAVILGLEHQGLEITDPIKAKIDEGAQRLGLVRVIDIPPFYAKIG